MEEEDIPEILAIEKLSFPNPWKESTFRGEIDNKPISFPYVIVHKTKKEAVTAALKEYIVHKKQLGITKLFGTIDFDKNYDYKKARSR